MANGAWERRGGGGGGGECSATLPRAFAAIAARKKVSLLLFDAVWMRSE